MRTLGVFTIRRHYYEPLFDPRDVEEGDDVDREIVGLDLNTDEQLALLDKFDYGDELRKIPKSRSTDNSAEHYHFGRAGFAGVDAEYFYSLIRFFKPRNIIEIGSGSSTLLAGLAVTQNKTEDPSYECRRICIEPFEQPWLEATGVQVERVKVEAVDPSIVETLQKNDILFIDSSHVVRPRGDVVFEQLRLLGRVKPGVLIHVHDIFTPRDYPNAWLFDEVRLYSEQYMLEAFLAFNTEFSIIGALNYLYHHHQEALSRVCPVHGELDIARVTQGPGRPTSLWFRRNEVATTS